MVKYSFFKGLGEIKGKKYRVMRNRLFGLRFVVDLCLIWSFFAVFFYRDGFLVWFFVVVYFFLVYLGFWGFIFK